MKKKIIVIILLVLFMFIFIGCNSPEATNGKSATNNQENKVVISYVSTNSKTYSSTAEVVSAVADTVVEISTESVVTSWGRQYISSGAGSGVIVGAGDQK